MFEHRITPNAPVAAFKTYSVKAPISTHFRPATCEEVDCAAFLNGWKTVLAETQTDMIALIYKSGRSFTMKQDGPMRVYRFEPGTKCFQASTHRVPLERDPLFIVRDGDWRGNPTGRRRVHQRAADWVEDFALHQQRVDHQYGGN